MHASNAWRHEQGSAVGYYRFLAAVYAFILANLAALCSSVASAADAYPSQGATATDIDIVVVRSAKGAFSDRLLVGALFTRMREQVTLVVDNLSSFDRRARGNSGEKASAVEIAAQFGETHARHI